MQGGSVSIVQGIVYSLFIAMLLSIAQIGYVFFYCLSHVTQTFCVNLIHSAYTYSILTLHAPAIHFARREFSTFITFSSAYTCTCTSSILCT